MRKETLVKNHVSAHQRLNPFQAERWWLVCTEAKSTSLSALPVLLHGWETLKRSPFKKNKKTKPEPNHCLSMCVTGNSQRMWVDCPITHFEKNHYKSWTWSQIPHKSERNHNSEIYFFWWLIRLMEPFMLYWTKQTHNLPPIHTRVCSFKREGGCF